VTTKIEGESKFQCAWHVSLTTCQVLLFLGMFSVKLVQKGFFFLLWCHFSFCLSWQMKLLFLLNILLALSGRSERMVLLLRHIVSYKQRKAGVDVLAWNKALKWAVSVDNRESIAEAFKQLMLSKKTLLCHAIVKKYLKLTSGKETLNPDIHITG